MSDEQRTVFSAFKKGHFEMQNENVFRLLKKFCSLCVCLNDCAVHVIHFSVLASGKNCKQ